MKDNKFINFILAILTALFLFCMVLFNSGCKMSEPSLKNYPAEMTGLEKKMQYEYEKCLYGQQYIEIDLRCDNILNRNDKIKIILIFNDMKKEKQLPEVYRKLGAEEMTFDDFFKYIK